RRNGNNQDAFGHREHSDPIITASNTPPETIQATQTSNQQTHPEAHAHHEHLTGHNAKSGNNQHPFLHHEHSDPIITASNTPPETNQATQSSNQQPHPESQPLPYTTLVRSRRNGNNQDAFGHREHSDPIITASNTPPETIQATQTSNQQTHPEAHAHHEHLTGH